MIQLRNVPDEIHRQAKMRAAMCGMTMSEYILRELKKALERPTREELLARIEKHPDLYLSPTPAELVRKERESH